MLFSILGPCGIGIKIRKDDEPLACGMVLSDGKKIVNFLVGLIESIYSVILGIGHGLTNIF